MKIKSLYIDNFRTLKNFHLNFRDNYNAISGKNNAGKSNLIKALKIFFDYRDEVIPFYDLDNDIYFQRDYPRWLSEEQKPFESITIELSFELKDKLDADLFKFIKTISKSVKNSKQISLDIKLIFNFRKRTDYVVKINNVQEDEFVGREIYNRIRNSKCFYLHNSTQQFPAIFHSKQMKMFINNNSTMESFRKAQKKFSDSLNKIAKENKEEISTLIGRLKDKYKVDISILTPDIEDLNYALSLGDKSYSTPISEWGSGTQNQTNILLALLRAHKKGEEGAMPVIVIEEPESFLHASSQADFGRILMDLSREFNIQIITTTHNIYMLNNKDPEANILLHRCESKKKPKFTEIIPMDKDNWMKPFATILGISNDVFTPWVDLVFAKNNNIILVEGEIDKKYFEFLRETKHGENQLLFSGDIVPYNGTSFFSNSEMLKYIFSKFDKVIITYDLDSKINVERKIANLNIDKKFLMIPIGVNEPGKNNIEGLLPEWVNEKLISIHPNLVNEMTSSDNEIRKRAVNDSKKYRQEIFIESADEKNDDCKLFYEVVKKINGFLNKKD